MTIKVFEDVLDEQLLNLLQETVDSEQIDWYQPTGGFSTVSNKYDKSNMNRNPKIVDSAQVVHPVLIDDEILSSHFPLCKIVISNILYNALPSFVCDDIHVHRIKFNLLTRDLLPDPKGTYFNPPHQDPPYKYSDKPLEEENNLSMLLYLSDSDGDTFFFEDGDFDGFGMIKRVAPKPGRVVIFDRNHVHCSSPPVKTMYRMVMNVCFIAPYELGDMYKYKEEEET